MNDWSTTSAWTDRRAVKASQALESYLRPNDGAQCAPPLQLQLPRLSIIVPCFNHERFIGRTLASIIGQQYPNTELIVIDGGSTDRSVEIIRQFAAHISYWESVPDRGQAHAINKGVARATGDWIAFQNSDDIYVPTAFASIACVCGSTTADIVYGDIFRTDERDRVCSIQLNCPIEVSDFRVRMPLNNQALFWRKSLCDAVGPLDESLKFCLDFEYVIRLFKASSKRVHIRQILGAQRLHRETKTSTLQGVHDWEFRQVIDSHFGSRASSRDKWHHTFGKFMWHLKQGNVWYLQRRRSGFRVNDAPRDLSQPR